MSLEKRFSYLILHKAYIDDIFMTIMLMLNAPISSRTESSGWLWQEHKWEMGKETQFFASLGTTQRIKKGNRLWVSF